MDETQLLKILEPMMAAFKREIADMRKAGASQADIDSMLDEFEKVYAPDDDDEGKLVVERSCQAGLSRRRSMTRNWLNRPAGI